MFRIGDFARISQVPVTSLRYYDDLGLLQPVRIDPWTGYRYYSASQLPQLNRILALKDLGFSLQETKDLVREDIPLEQLRGMLRLRQADARRSVEVEMARLNRVELRLRQLEMEGKMPGYEVVVKRVDPMLVASARGLVEERRLSPRGGSVVAEGDLVQEIGAVCDRLAGQVNNLLKESKARGNGPWFLLYGQSNDDITLEMAAPVDPGSVEKTRYAHDAEAGIRPLAGAEEVASTIHQGPYESIADAYSALGRWIEDNGYTVVGQCREVYLHHDTKGNPTAHVTEIQFPVAKPSNGAITATA